VPVQDVFPPGVRPAEYIRLQRQVFDESRRVAAAAAARTAGLQVTVSGSGARIVEVVGGSPADGLLRTGDVIVEVDGEPVSTTADVVDAVRSRPTGTDLGVVIERDDTRHTVVVTPEELPDVAGRVGIGVLLETRGLDVDLPFEIRFDDLDVGGPSAGLAYGMAIADLLHEADLARGRTIAATGTISIDGGIGPVGGVEQKAIAVDDAGADLFVVPQSEVNQATGEGLTVRGARTLEEALAAAIESSLTLGGHFELAGIEAPRCGGTQLLVAASAALLRARYRFGVHLNEDVPAARWRRWADNIFSHVGVISSGMNLGRGTPR
jgi:Lon-like protease